MICIRPAYPRRGRRESPPCARMTNARQPCQIGMSKPLVGRSGGKRQVLWRRVCARGLDAGLAVFVVFLIVTCMVGASSEGPFFETWWGGHLFILLLCFLAPAVLLAAVWPMSRWLRLPLDQLPDLCADSGGSGSEDRRARLFGAEVVLAGAAVRTLPVVGQVFERRARGDALGGVALFGVIDVSA